MDEQMREKFEVFYSQYFRGKHYSTDALANAVKAHALAIWQAAFAASKKAEAPLHECLYESDQLKFCKKCGQVHDKAIFPAALSQPAAQEIDELKTICAETYQVVGSLASDLGIFGSCLQLGKVLDNLSQLKRVHNDVLPWPSFEAQGDSSHPAGGECGGVPHPATVESFIGESEQADFEDDTWTFKMQPGYSVGAGFYRITYIGLTAPKATP